MEKNNAANKDTVSVADDFGILYKKVKYLEKNTKSDYKRNKKDHENMESSIRELDKEVHSGIKELYTQSDMISDLCEKTEKTDKNFIYAIIAFGILHVVEIATFFIIIENIIK